ncbi:hypothetical protein FPCIR_1955 [Fusarium pseudocircinatum]|uniref:Uncharacterized protein n=1 Tax=Fusarium pseudocircinatum TaxID=56676 RepID=A0A8H5PSR4_9HYPO|nr:hypothetical protein FPCIR_1955 [Fusarium pseudocircinatum]
MPSTKENKTKLIAKAKNIKQDDLINMSADAATIEACFTLITMSRGTHKIKQQCQTSACNKSVKTSFYCESCQAHARARARVRADSQKHSYSTRSKVRKN